MKKYDIRFRFSLNHSFIGVHSKPNILNESWHICFLPFVVLEITKASFVNVKIYGNGFYSEGKIKKGVDPFKIYDSSSMLQCGINSNGITFSKE